MAELGEAGVPLAWLQVQIMHSNETDRQPLVAAAGPQLAPFAETIH